MIVIISTFLGEGIHKCNSTQTHQKPHKNKSMHPLVAKGPIQKGEKNEKTK